MDCFLNTSGNYDGQGQYHEVKYLGTVGKIWTQGRHMEKYERSTLSDFKNATVGFLLSI